MTVLSNSHCNMGLTATRKEWSKFADLHVKFKLSLYWYQQMTVTTNLPRKLTGVCEVYVGNLVAVFDNCIIHVDANAPSYLKSSWEAVVRKAAEAKKRKYTYHKVRSCVSLSPPLSVPPTP